MADNKGSAAGYRGAVGLVALNFDIDRDDHLEALADARRPHAPLSGRYGRDAVVAYYSGGKGYHLVVPVPAGAIALAPDVPAIAKVLALRTAEEAGVVVDPAVYDVLRIWRAPNTRHPKSGRCKLQLSAEELESLDAAAIASSPRAAAVPSTASLPGPFLAARDVLAAAPAPASRSATAAAGVARLNVTTRRFLEDPLETHEAGRAVALYSAAADLVESSGDDVDALVELLQLPIALEIDVEATRQIRCGIDRGRGL
ncbi:hypothetical protein [Paludisphaera mucosa]|uniref:DNA primase n=1 Tax=Paludisphaera mucosa TaxID=3030827 RepID=A0ABT6FCX5_9BACT|nr:hypothetical protein [Paludisphaera mucosa]MDG3005387.1 hypothetical protein [Paludisphaera mucosa]